MDFLGIGFPELLLILLVIILVIGPKDIGKTARSIGRFLNRLYKSDEWRTITQASKTIRTLPNRLAREAELDELKEVKASLEDAKKDFEDVKKDLDKDAELVKETEKELIQEAKSIEEGLKSWVASSNSQEDTNKSRSSLKPMNTAAEENQPDLKSQDT